MSVRKLTRYQSAGEDAKKGMIGLALLVMQADSRIGDDQMDIVDELIENNSFGTYREVGSYVAAQRRRINDAVEAGWDEIEKLVGEYCGMIRDPEQKATIAEVCDEISQTDGAVEESEQKVLDCIRAKL